MNTILPSQDSLLSAYMNTDYSFKNGSRIIIIKLDESNPGLLDFIEHEQIITWAYMTAWNSLSFPQTNEYNQSQQQLLLEKLRGYKLYKGAGKSRNGNWPAEESHFVAGIAREEVCAVGRDFGQNVILVSDINLEPELVFLF